MSKNEKEDAIFGYFIVMEKPTEIKSIFSLLQNGLKP